MEASKQKKLLIAALVICIFIIIYLLFRKKSSEKLKADAVSQSSPAESSFRGHGGGGRFFHGGRGRWGGGYGYYPYPYYDDEPIIVRSTKCPEGYMWMGAMLGCEKPPTT